MNNRPVLLVMRATDMHVAHPQTDWSYRCARCGQLVGVSPSGLRITSNYPEIELVCQVCGRGEFVSVQPAPGALAEARQSVVIRGRRP